jgi:hypothetical protein
MRTKNGKGEKGPLIRTEAWNYMCTLNTITKIIARYLNCKLFFPGIASNIAVEMDFPSPILVKEIELLPDRNCSCVPFCYSINV